MLPQGMRFGTSHCTSLRVTSPRTMSLFCLRAAPRGSRGAKGAAISLRSLRPTPVGSAMALPEPFVPIRRRVVCPFFVAVPDGHPVGTSAIVTITTSCIGSAQHLGRPFAVTNILKSRGRFPRTTRTFSFALVSRGCLAGGTPKSRVLVFETVTGSLVMVGVNLRAPEVHPVVSARPSRKCRTP